MNSRIRYVKKTDSRWESQKTYNHETNGARYKVLLDETAGSWYVVDAEGGTVAAQGQETTFHKVKKSAKTALEALGVLFKAEARVKRVSHLHLVSGQPASFNGETPDSSGEELG